jgi:protein-disulfide isomerase
MRCSVNGMPTLYINEVRYDGNLDSLVAAVEEAAASV